MKARVPNFAKANGKATVNEKKSSGFFSSKKDSKSKEKDKEKEKDVKDKEKEKDAKDKESSSPKQRSPPVAHMPHPASFSTLYQLHQMQNGMLTGTMKHNGIFHRHNSQPEPFMWHAKSYESGIGNDSHDFFSFFKMCVILNNLHLLDAEMEPAYPIYGRLPTPARGYVPVVPRTMYVGDWE
jgi:hypothetical protein